MRIHTIKIICLFFSIASALQAAEHSHAHLSAHITGLRHDNTCFLCIPNEGGCFSLQAAAKGKIFPINMDSLQKVYLLDTKSLKLSAQAIPSSCQVPLHLHQTLEMTGNFTQKLHPHIDHMQCRVIG